MQEIDSISCNEVISLDRIKDKLKVNIGQEKYIIDIGEQGSKGLGKLDYCFNPTTQEFLLQSGLKKAKTILDIGCGSGAMTCWMARQVHPAAKIIAIENNSNQLEAAKENAEELGIKNIEFQLCSAYEIELLEQKFDLIYCRFVLHHLHEPMKVISKIYDCLNPDGVYVAEEGIVNFAFSYPFSPAWGDEASPLCFIFRCLKIKNPPQPISSFFKKAPRIKQSLK